MIKRDYQEVFDRLPSKWEDVSLRTAIKYLNVEFEVKNSEDEMENVEVGLNNIFKTISVLTEIPLEEVKETPYTWINQMALKTAFMNEQPKPNKTSKIEWKELEDVSYNNFIIFSQLQKETIIDKMPILIKEFAKNKMTEEEILELDVVEIHTGFFLLRKKLRKSIQRMKTSSRKLLMKQKLRKLFQRQKPIREKLQEKN